MITLPEKYNENNIKKLDLDFNAKYVETSSNIGSFLNMIIKIKFYIMQKMNLKAVKFLRICEICDCKNFN
jgi:hypothetical protein